MSGANAEMGKKALSHFH